ncbi:MAG: NAD(P)H-dependent oxidoreductase [candidate division KSB1 bacterium]|nr:NAD(P)H-dependent oxidoreductase [candidate division KSB1 bacterium]MDZ7304957.1 NAD(P)H-dependent oxidoreductase [candidate division KSB1 bacterium]MDZ7314010.1 NAD(P)H-dependent oxidoreductase [candidate division KSB1 bacterium]
MTKLCKASLLISCFLLNIAYSQQSVNVLIVYYSTHGHTQAMAEAVAKGARSVDGVTVKVLGVAEAKSEEVLAADAIIVGSPAYNANIAPPVQNFINNWPFAGAPLRDKIGAAFVTAGGISAGEELVQMSVLHSMLIYGMIVVGGPDWRQPFGASGIVSEEPFNTEKEFGKVDAHFLAKGEALGKRVAELARRWKLASAR